MSQLSNFPSVQTYLPSKEGIYVWQLLPCSLYPLKGVETSSHKMSVCLKFLLKDHEWSFYKTRSAVGFKILAKYIWEILIIWLRILIFATPQIKYRYLLVAQQYQSLVRMSPETTTMQPVMSIEPLPGLTEKTIQSF